MTFTKDNARQALSSVPAPGKTGDLVSTGAVEWIAHCEAAVSIKLHLDPATRGSWDQVSAACASALVRAGAAAGQPITSVIVEFVDHAGTVLHTARPAAFGGAASALPNPSGTPATTPAVTSASTHTARAASAPAASNSASAGRAATPQGGSKLLPGVQRVIAVGAGKGGVGKSTISVNLAVALARQGYSVGLMDGDIYGPSFPTLLGLRAMDVVTLGGMLQPFVVHGVKAMTIGKLVDEEKPLIWRGPMAHGAFKQLAEQTSWGELDYLIIDLPPGTGDVPLTMAQLIQLAGAVVVCTPQQVAQDDAVRAAKMFQQLGIPVLGVVENMSYFVCEHGTEYDIFGRGGAEYMAQRLGVPFLGAVPITPELRKNSDSGNPSDNFIPGPLASSLENLSRNLLAQVTLESMRQGQTRPTLSIR